MREQFQRAFSDLTASADLVKWVRADAAILSERYELTALELRRLVAIVNQPGMECNCILYRANRLAPVVINLPKLCAALGSQLRPLLSEYWVERAQLSDNFWVEAHDFSKFVERKIAEGSFAEEVVGILIQERSVVVEQLKQIHPEKYEVEV